jgi:hypothetical protein
MVDVEKISQIADSFRKGRYVWLKRRRNRIFSAEFRIPNVKLPRITSSFKQSVLEKEAVVAVNEPEVWPSISDENDSDGHESLVFESKENLPSEYDKSLWGIETSSVQESPQVNQSTKWERSSPMSSDSPQESKSIIKMTYQPLFESGSSASPSNNHGNFEFQGEINAKTSVDGKMDTGKGVILGGKQPNPPVTFFEQDSDLEDAFDALDEFTDFLEKDLH